MRGDIAIRLADILQDDGNCLQYGSNRCSTQVNQSCSRDLENIVALNSAGRTG